MNKPYKKHLPLAFSKSAAYLLSALLSAALFFSGCGSSQLYRSLPELLPKTESQPSVNEGDKAAFQEEFDRLTDQIFRDTATNSLLDLHYTVTDPKALQLKKPESLYGDFTLESLQEETASTEEMLSRLQAIPKSSLTPQSQLDYDILLSYLETECMAKGLEEMVRPLAPTIGIQAQLPVLLAEYAFYSPQDIEDYFLLLEGLDDYFGQLLAFEEQRAANGLMVSDDAIQRIVDSCQPYLESVEKCILSDTFSEKLEGLKDLTQEEKEGYILRHQQLICDRFIPAYKHLSDGLLQLKGTGKIEGGLCNYPGGKDFYRYMVYASTATSCKNVDTLAKTVKKRIDDDFKAMASLLRAQPQLLDELDNAGFALTDPVEILSYLQEAIKEEYPEPICKDYSLHYVPKALEPVLSPAFYLTPPVDRPGINPIYINQGSTSATKQLFSTLAHEGYPGHLYQSAYFVAQKPALFRHVLSFSAYSEGWATYVEYQSYRMDPQMSPSMAKLLSTDSAISLGIHAYIDLMVNDQGWGIPEIYEYVSQYYSDPDKQFSTALYQAMTDNPTNYLEYYVGYLEFSDMRQKAEKALGKSFQPKKFHRFLLDIGPAPFPVIRDRLNAWIKTGGEAP